ncbi:MAG: type IV pilin [Thermoplasmatota archaeon]
MGVSDIVGTMLTVAIAVLLAGAITLALFAIPGPQAQAHTAMQAFILPSNPAQLIVEQEGGRAISLQDLKIIITRNSTPTGYVVGTLVHTTPTVWADRTPGGSYRAYTGSFQPGDQILYNSSADGNPGSTFQRQTLSVTEVDLSRNGVVTAGSGVSIGGSAGGEGGGGGSSGGAPTFVNLTSPPQARTFSATNFSVNFTTPLAVISKSDFTLAGYTITGVYLIGNGATAVFSVTPSFTSSATPLLSTVASPSGTRDLFGNPLAGGKSIRLADGIPPTISNLVATITGGTTASISWTTDEPASTGLLYGPAPGIYGLSQGCFGRTCALTTSHTLALTSLSSVSKYFFSVESTDNQSTTAYALGNFTTPFINGPTFTVPTVHLLYVAVEYKSTTSYLGVNVLNPTSTTLTLTHLYINASPPFGGGSHFFNGASVGQNSDSSFGTCGWGSSQTTDTLVCTPNGATGISVPPGQMREVVIGFTTSSLNGGAYTILVANATFQNARPSVSNYWNVLHTGGAVGSANQVILLPWNNTASQFRANMGTVVGGQADSFYFEWQNQAGTTTNVAIFYVPAGWTNLTVPAQTALSTMTVKVVQPTTTSPGYVEVGLNLAGGASNGFFFQATPPLHGGISILTVDERSDSSGSGETPAPALFETGTVIS